MFRDELTVRIKAGDGGRGGRSFRREKFAPRGGPDGGNGGKGGDVIFEADENLNTLYPLRHLPQLKAQDGGPGGAKNCYGKNGHDLLVKVPVGTLIYDIAKNIMLKDLKRAGQTIVLAKGGRGGKGNRAFASSSYQTPRRAEPGAPGEELHLRLELKMIADVGLVGMPNAGKSTLLARMSHARPKIADYPFTTLAPNLGVVAIDEYRSFVMADLPGLIEGAHKGVGLGDKFLRHVERTRILLHLVDVSETALAPPEQAYGIIREELEAFSPSLAEKKELVVATKMDLPGAREGLERLEGVAGKPILGISPVTRKGVKELANVIRQFLQEPAEKPF